MHKLQIAALLSAAALLASPSLKAAEPWQDPNHFEENRLPMRTTFHTDGESVSLNGTWKFLWSETPADRSLDFYKTSVDDSAWGTMPVPGMWELNGYGDPVYVNNCYVWSNFYESNPPYVPVERNHVGQYRRTITVPADWKGQDIFICIGSATSNVRVWVNGKMVGYSQDSKLEARFDITKFVKPGEDNLIALEVFRWCDGTYLEDQDFWRLTGLARDTYIYERPKHRIEDIHVDAHADGTYAVSAKTTAGVQKIRLVITAPDGSETVVVKAVDKTKDSEGLFNTSVEGTMPHVKLWTAETPDLYKLTVSAADSKTTTETASLKFGFRDVEIKGNQLLVNGKPVLIKGVDRHELNPYKGYVVSREDMLRDITIFKHMNINTVRTCHYPNDPYWYELCDEYGIYVWDEGNIESHGMGYEERTLAKDPQYEAAHMSRDQRMVQRDYNHPSIIIFSPGNESGDGPNFVKTCTWIRENCGSRVVAYEQARTRDHTDIYCPMYATPDHTEKYALDPESHKPLIQCEYNHTMGNSGGGLKEYWDLIRKYPILQGGCIWDFMDQALYKPVTGVEGTDHIWAFGGDYNDVDASDASFNCNGLVASDRTWHPHAYEAAYQYQNIWTTATAQEALAGKIHVYNENFFIDLSRYALEWSIMVDGKVAITGSRTGLDIKPGTTSAVYLDYTAEDVNEACGGSIEGHDVYLNVKYIMKRSEGLLQAGDQVAYDQIAICEQANGAYLSGAQLSCSPAAAQDSDGKVTYSGTFVTGGTGLEGRPVEWSVSFDKATGALASYKIKGREIVKEPMMPSFGRALTENDNALWQREKIMGCLYPDFKVVSFEAAGSTVKVAYEVTSAGHDGSLSLEVSYTVHEDGSVAVCEHLLKPSDSKPFDFMFRFGMEMALDGELSTLDFYGKGPWENYVDRASAAQVGHYNQSVLDQYDWTYPRPQESGTHTALKYFDVTNWDGFGLGILAGENPGGEPFSASALPIARKDIDMSLTTSRNTHSLDYKGLAHELDRAQGSTYLHFESRQAGVGGINTWGQWPLEQYRLPVEEMTFDFVIRPLYR